METYKFWRDMIKGGDEGVSGIAVSLMCLGLGDGC